MYIWGIHLIDALIVVVYLLLMLWIGKLVSKKIHSQEDFYLAGRKFGKTMQFFLYFGQSTDANNAIKTCSFVFRAGIGGLWLTLVTLFLTPFYWFLNLWFRRVRLITTGDLLEDRLGSKALPGMYAVLLIAIAMLDVGIGFMLSCKTMEALMIKPVHEYTAHEKQIISDYQEFRELQEKYETGKLPSEKLTRYEQLQSLANSDKLRAYISYLNPLLFYIVYTLVVGIYVILGGFAAAAITDAVQGILIIIFSLMLIPLGLIKTGGFSGLHASVPDYMFNLFGSVTSEWTWHSISAYIFLNLIGSAGWFMNMAVSGSAKSEMAARLSAVTGGYTKRFVIIAWGFCGLIAFALFRDQIHQPDSSWGVLSFNLLVPGLIGLMLAGILAANMSSIDAQAIHLSALFTRNLYQPFVPKKLDKHYIFVGRIAIAAVLIGGIFIALSAPSIITLVKAFAVVNTIFGAPVLLSLFWRRLTKTAVISEVLILSLLVFVIPWVTPLFPAATESKALTISTIEKQILISETATQQDVEKGLAQKAGQKIQKQHIIEPSGIFFERLAHKNPRDINSPLIGKGRFNVELYLLSKIGFDFREFTPAGLVSTRFFSLGILIFALLIVISFFGAPPDKKMLDRFFVKMKTPVTGDIEKDEAELRESYENPTRFDHLKLFPKSRWEFCKWTKIDAVGFVLCLIVAVAIIAFLWFVLRLGQ